MRKLVLIVALLYVVGLGTLAVLVLRASPGPETQEILGVGIGRYGEEGGIVYLSGRRLECEPAGADSLFAERCEVEIAGSPLTILAQRNPDDHRQQLGGACEARYEGRSWPCEIRSRHVHVHWFAYLDEPLGLDEAELAALRRRYPFENMAETAFFPGMVGLAFVSLIVAAAVSWVLLSPQMKSRAVRLAAAAVTGMVALFGTLALAFYVTRGLWD